MKHIFIALLTVLLFSACHDVTVGYLITENASYSEDTMYIYKRPDPVKNAPQHNDGAPWVTYALSGYEGTTPIIFSIENVTSPDAGKEAVQSFLEELTIRGGGVMEVPVKNKLLQGTYRVSIRLTNPGYSQILENAMTFIVKE